MSDLYRTNSEYKKWISQVSLQFKSSQIKAASKVNEEMLRFYWTLGKDISFHKRESKQGNDFYATVSSDLKKELPDVKSFSATNIKYMQYFYELYSSPQVVDSADEKCSPQLVDSIEEIFKIPWGHHRYIIDKCKENREKALFFVRESLKNCWSRSVLLNFLDTNLYERKGKAITNFDKVLPDIQTDLAKEITKDPYNFDFLTLRENFDEKELKDALMDNFQSFALEMGKGFALLGREYRVEVGSTEQFLDMLFYNTVQHCYVVVEFKVRAFEPGDMGQLGTYVAIVDGEIKTEIDNPTVGLLICKTKDNVLAKYAVNSMNVPIGISEFSINDYLPEDYKSSMPTIEEIESELNDKE